MKNNKKCKIVQDILPNYIENLTSKETNDFIEKHIQECKECETVLKDMKGDIKLEKINTKKKKSALRKVKRKIIITILVLSIISFLLAYLIFQFFSNYRIYKDDNGKINIEKYKISLKKFTDEKYVVIKSKHKEGGTIDGFSYKTLIVAIDNNEICVNIRVKIKGLNTEYLEYLFNRYKEQEENDLETDPKIEGESITYTYNYFNGKKLNEILDSYYKGEILEIIYY